jgi:hypothetical protein
MNTVQITASQFSRLAPRSRPRRSVPRSRNVFQVAATYNSLRFPPRAVFSERSRNLDQIFITGDTATMDDRTGALLSVILPLPLGEQCTQS